MQAIRIYALKSKRPRPSRRLAHALEELDSKINYFRSLRSKGPDKFAAKGALSTIEYQVNMAYSTLKIISEHLANKKVVLLDNSLQAKRFMLEQSVTIMKNNSKQFLQPNDINKSMNKSVKGSENFA